MSAPGLGTGSLASSEQRPRCARPEARHAPETGIQAGGGHPISRRASATAPLFPRGQEGRAPADLVPSASAWPGVPGSRGVPLPGTRRLPRPAPAPALPLGSRQTAAQPARQHLRLSAHSPSEPHSCVQFSSSFSSGHTPAFPAPAPGRDVRTVSGRPEPGPEDAHLLRRGPQISSFKER